MIRTASDLKAANARFKGRVPLLANMVEGGKTPILPAAELEALGFSIVIFAAGLVRSFAFMAREYFAAIKRDGSTAAFRDRMLDFKGLNAVVGTPQMFELGKRYDGEAK